MWTDLKEDGTLLVIGGEVPGADSELRPVHQPHISRTSVAHQSQNSEEIIGESHHCGFRLSIIGAVSWHLLKAQPIH